MGTTIPEKALIIRRVVKLLIFQKELRLIFRNDPLHDERSCLVKMFDDAAHGFGIQICAVNLPRSPGRRLRHREQFRFDKSTDCRVARSEEHTSELQSLTNLVCRLLLEKKKYI